MSTDLHSHAFTYTPMHQPSLICIYVHSPTFIRRPTFAYIYLHSSALTYTIDKAPENGANKPDMTTFDKKNKVIILVEGTVCNIGQINDRNDYKKRKYLDLRLGLRKLYPDYEIKQTNIVFNFLGDFNTTLRKELSDLAHKKNVT